MKRTMEIVILVFVLLLTVSFGLCAASCKSPFIGKLFNIDNNLQTPSPSTEGDSTTVVPSTSSSTTSSTVQTPEAKEGTPAGARDYFGSVWTLYHESSGTYSQDIGKESFQLYFLPITFRMPEKEDQAIISDKIEWALDMDTISGFKGDPDNPLLVYMSGDFRGEEWLEGRIEDDNFIFLLHFNYLYGKGEITGEVSGSDEWWPGGQFTGDEWISMEIKDNSKFRKDFNQEGFKGFEEYTLKRNCETQIPEIKSGVDSVLISAVSQNEAPQTTHDKLTQVTINNFPVNKSFNLDSTCYKVTGYSVDLQYIIGDTEDSIYKSMGSTNGEIHRIVSGSVDQIVNRSGGSIQVFYTYAIDISLNQI